MSNAELASLLRKIAAAYTVLGENKFKTIAYEQAAESIEKSMVDVKGMWRDGKLDEIPGIGKSMAGHLNELFTQGKVKHFDDILAKVPQAIFPLLDLPGFGPKKAYKLVKELGLKDSKTVIQDLGEAAKAGKIAEVEGFGKKSEQEVLEALGRFKKGRSHEGRMPLPYAYEVAEEMIAYLKKNPKTKEAVPLGSLRRSVSTIGDVDIAASTDHPEEVIDWFIGYPHMAKIVDRGPAGATILLANGKQVDVRVQTPAKFGAMLQYFTGSKRHNITLREYALRHGLSLNEYGMKPVGEIKLKISKKHFNPKANIYEFATEEQFYEALGLPWIPPEIREDTGEIDVAKGGKLPDLVELSQIKGDFHIHSDYDLDSSHDIGASSVEDLVKQATALGYEYIGISDHNPSTSKNSEQQICSILKKRKEYIEHINYSTKSVRVHLFTMLETDIQPSGKLAIPNEAFKFLDASIVSIHSTFAMDREKMTERILKGFSHPKAKILAHPTGRLLGSREGYEVDWQKLFEFAHKHDKAIEINAFPERLDLPDLLVREAIAKGVRLVISTDSHAREHMMLMRYGVSVARRGWATRRDILNTMGYNEIRKWLLK